MKQFLFAIFLVTLLVSSNVYAQSTDDVYLAMIDKAVTSKLQHVNWLEIRKAYQDTTFYMGEAGDIMIRMKMGKIADSANTPEGKKVYLDFARKHFAMYRSHFYDAAMAKNGKGGFANFETNMNAVKGLLDSVQLSGDGASCDTSMYAIDTGEEYMVLQARGVKPDGQAVVQSSGKICDKLDFIDPKTGKKGSLFFDITKLMSKPVK